MYEESRLSGESSFIVSSNPCTRLVAFQDHP